MPGGMIDLYADCRNCTACPLHETRTNTVFGVGPTDAKVMLIGEAPGENEDLSGEPFVGRGGQLLDLYLNSVGLDRTQNVYICNILKCRPPHNRDPLPAEEDACIHYLNSQISIIRPRIIVCLGRIAAFRIISPDFKVTKEHGIFSVKNGVLIMGTFHPAAILRDPSKRGACLNDFMALRKKMMELGIMSGE